MPVQLVKDYIDNLRIIVGCQEKLDMLFGDQLFGGEQTSSSAGASAIGENRKHWWIYQPDFQGSSNGEFIEIFKNTSRQHKPAWQPGLEVLGTLRCRRKPIQIVNWLRAL